MKSIYVYVTLCISSTTQEYVDLKVEFGLCPGQKLNRTASECYQGMTTF